jgi:hypothetical protein
VRDVRPRGPAAALSCLGVLVLAAAMGLCSALAHRSGPGQPGSLWAAPSSAAATLAGSAEDVLRGPGNGLDQALPALLPERARDVSDLAASAGGAADGLPVLAVVLTGLVACAVAIGGPRTMRRRSDAHRYETRAPPVGI